MATIFCPSCGAKANYMHAPPNFCGKCGQPYVPSFSSKTRASLVRKKDPRDDEDEIEDDEDWGSESTNARGDYFSDSMRVPRLSKLNVDIDSSSDVRVFKMSDILGQQSNANFEIKQPRSLDDFIDEQ